MTSASSGLSVAASAVDTVPAGSAFSRAPSSSAIGGSFSRAPSASGVPQASSLPGISTFAAPDLLSAALAAAASGSSHMGMGGAGVFSRASSSSGLPSHSSHGPTTHLPGLSAADLLPAAGCGDHFMRAASSSGLAALHAAGAGGFSRAASSSGPMTGGGGGFGRTSSSSGGFGRAPSAPGITPLSALSAAGGAGGAFSRAASSAGPVADGFARAPSSSGGVGDALLQALANAAGSGGGSSGPLSHMMGFNSGGPGGQLLYNPLAGIHGGSGGMGGGDGAGYTAAARRPEEGGGGMGMGEHDVGARREGGRGGKAGRRGPIIEDPKRLAADFAEAVTTPSSRGGDWVARNGDESLFSTLRRVLPQVRLSNASSARQFIGAATTSPPEGRGPAAACSPWPFYVDLGHFVSST